MFIENRKSSADVGLFIVHYSTVRGRKGVISLYVMTSQAFPTR